MHRPQLNGTLPIRNLPSPVVGREVEKEPPPHYLEWAMTRVYRSMQQVQRYYADQARIVEEYANVGSILGTGETQLVCVPNYSPGSERITCILVTGTPTSTFTLKLGSRVMFLSTDANGKCLLSPVQFTLEPDDDRIVTITENPTNWFFQLSGYALRANEI
jgi:hypothetical protein